MPLPDAGRALKALLQILLLLLLMAGSDRALAADKFCSDAPYFGVIDGAVLANPPTQISVDSSCTFRNWPQSEPLTTTINFNFQSGDPLSLIVFDNVYYTGNMACSNTEDKFKIWFANSSLFAGNNQCQDLFIPIEKIDKASPAATASVGVPFTYTLTIPVMFDPATGVSSNFASANDLGNIHLTDDLTAAATGAEMTLVSLNAYIKGTGTVVPVTNAGDSKHLDFTLPDIAKGTQIVVEVTVVLDDVPGNSAGTVFTNVAKWEFSRAVDIDEDGVIEPGEFFNPLPGEWGTAAPMTIAEPSLIVNKTSTTTALDLADSATFRIDVQNAGGSAAWNVALRDNLPDGMCATDPAATLVARILAADGTTLVRNLAAGSDYTLNFTGAPTCRFDLVLTTAGGAIAPDQRLVVTYDSALDPGFMSDGATLTNVAGAVQWYNDAVTNAGRRVYNRTLSDGTPAVADHQDSQTVTAGLSGYYFEKTVTNLATGAYPATTAAPGDRLRYHLRLFNVDQNINGITFTDTLDVASRFVGSSFGNVVLPAGATYSFNSTTGALTVTGNGAPLNLSMGGELEIEFEITLRADLTHGMTVSNQASLAAAAGFTALSDDPYVNGVADPAVAGDEDPTSVLIQTPGPMQKTTTQATATIGERFTYRLTIPAVATPVPLYDVRIQDNLALSAANLRFVSAAVVSGGSWTLSNVGTATSPVIADTVTGIDIAPFAQAVIDVTVELSNTATNQRGLAFVNSAAFTYNRVNGSAATQKSGGTASSGSMTITEPTLAAGKAVSFVTPAGKTTADPATVGDVLQYTVTLANTGDATAFDANVVDTLPAGMSLVANSATATLNGVAVAGFVAEPTVLSGTTLAWGRQNGDGSLDIPAGQALVLTYRVTVETASGAPAVNSARADWTSRNDAPGAERTGAGCPAITQPNDYCAGPVTASVGTVDNTFLTKAVSSDSWAEAPASTTDPVVRVGDTVTYDLVLHLQEYTTRNVVVQDVLPQGLAFESATFLGSGFTYTLAAQPAANATGTLRWEFGDIVNAPSNDGTPLDTLTIRYVARVLPEAPATGVAYTTSLTRDNVATLAYTGGDPALYPARLQAGDRIEIRQAQMSALAKTETGGGRTGTGTQADPYRVNLASDVMQFRLSSCNTGLAPAYGVIVSDTLAAPFDEGDIAAQPPVVRIGASTLVAGTHYTLTLPPRGGELRIVLNDSAPVNPNACVTVDYRVGFHTDLVSSTTWSNAARIAGFYSLPAQAGRLYPAGATASLWMTNLASGYQLLKTLGSATQATVGDEVVYTIRVPAVPVNVAMNNVAVSDTLHAALEYVGATATLNGSPLALTDNSVAPGQVSLGIAAIPAGQQAVITLRTRVANNAAANAGVSVTNTASYSWTGMPAGITTSSTSAPFMIIEPQLALTRAASTTTPSPGSLVNVTLTFTASGGTAADNFSNAFDLALRESLDLGLVYEAGSARLNGAVLADPALTGDGVGTAQTLDWDPANGIDIDLAEGATATLTYSVRVLAGVAAGQTLNSSAVARWTGRNGTSAVERTGSNMPAVNDYFTAPVGLALATPLAFTATKSVLNVSTGQNPGNNAAPGDVLRYTVVLQNDSVVAVGNAALTDHLALQFAAGSLQMVSLSDAGATDASSASGGSNGRGLVDIRNISLAPQGSAGDSVTVVFEATLAPVLASGTTVLNQSQMARNGTVAATSNQTSTLIGAAPQWRVQKTSQDLSGDSSVLLPGDTLRYTITVQNIGDEHAIGVTLRDLLPSFTRYVAGSTTLNGVAVADVGGASALQAGLLIRAPGSTGAGQMNADASGAAANTATIGFSVTVESGAVAGTVISNQGFVTGAGEGSGAFAEQPSDDPATTAVNDPTRDIVGALPLLDAQKTVALVVDNGAAGVVEPGDTLRYTIVVSNSSAIAASGVTLSDDVPANTSYVGGSLTLNGAAAGQPDGGLLPLAAGFAIQSPAAASGAIAGNAGATVTFEVVVNGGVPAGTVISNQGFVASNELATEPTDADGNDANGDQPTTIVTGSAQQLSIIKEVSVVGGGAALPGSQLDYVVRITNTGAVPATQVLIADDLAALAGQASYVANSATLNGSTTGVSEAGSVLLADYAAAYGNLAAGGTATLRFRVQIGAGVAAGTMLSNTGTVSWGSPTLTASSTVDIAVGGLPGSVALNGRVWHDADFDNVNDAGERKLGGWSVELYRGATLLGSASTDSDGVYRFSGLAATVTAADQYELRFRAPGATATTAMLGLANSAFTNGLQRISAIGAAGGSSVQDLDLPVDPNGVVFDAILRAPVAGATLTLTDSAGTPVAAGCFDDPAQQNQVTGTLGFYKFDLNFSDASCPSGGSYLIRVTAPAGGYEAGVSRLVPPTSSDATAAYSVPVCASDANAGSAECEAQASENVPAAGLPAGSYYLHLQFAGSALPADSQVFNNHIPLDPVLGNAVAIRKTSARVNVSRGDLVPYVITVNNTLPVALTDINLVDRFPAGFKYVTGSARLDGVAVEPVASGRTLNWGGLTVPGNTQRTLKLLMIPGAGVSEGAYVNRAQAINTVTGSAASGEASATVRVVPDPTFDCSDVIGKVFDDANLNGMQDAGEKGLPGVRLATARGLIVTTDAHGRYHLSCALTPDEHRGANFIVKVDDRTLPTGFRLTTENPLVQRATRGKLAKFNFGATLHRVVRLDLASGVFVPQQATLRPQWETRLPLLLEQLVKAPAVLRVAYMAETEDAALVEARVKAVKREIAKRWAAAGNPYELSIETEVFWRTGAPPARRAAP
ncbi:MAG: conserved repeat domain protein [Moraxellaceae bacterium]|nr:conserved repeat domain protein [Moraxellaceae bacterium]